jgi:serine phosphatase RsbU (regulator of sigma subunit)
MKKWAYHAPMNYQHKYDLVEAERARVLNRDADAMEYYDRAIAGAKENEYVNEEALALELTAKFYLEKGREKIAQVYMMDARYAYLRWGAMAKVKDLDERYPQLLRKSETAASSLDDTMTDATSTGEGKGSVLDLSTVMKASQTISGEIVLEKLLQQMMRIVIENAGAEKGFLILEQKGQLMIEAEAGVGQDDIRVLQSVPVKDNPAVSEGIINYVARTKERVILNDAVHEGDFRDEPYIVEKQPKSILCTPLIHQGKLSGILYLENNLTTGAFTADRLEMLNLLSAQAAISIENASLYENLEQLVDERTKELSQALEVIEEAKEAAEKELQDAHQMQMSLMPETAPKIEGLEIAGRCIPASTVSGDFFDYLEGKSDNEVAIVIADVTGKAMKGAMNAVMTNGILRAKAEEMEMFSPGLLMTRMNGILKARTERLMNVTMVIGMIDARTKTLTLANAGHHVLPLLCREGKIQQLQVTGFFPLGVVKDTQYSEEKFQLQSGDVLILMTDGIIEAQDSEANYYSDSGRLEKTISQFTLHQSAESMVEAILNDAIAFGGDKATRDDDMTVVVAKVQ